MNPPCMFYTVFLGFKKRLVYHHRRRKQNKTADVSIFRTIFAYYV